MRFTLSILTLVFILTGCKVSYTFSGTDVGNAQTISIAIFSNRAALTPPIYPQTFTEELKDEFLRQTKLQIVQENGDLQMNGEIVAYTANPVSSTGDETTALNRLQVTIKVNYINTLDPTKNFNRNFSRFEDYSSTENLSTIENALLESITEQLAQEIIQASIGSW
ncbi:MAG TPA: hypothetical protein DDX92_04660 [Flavobacteriales bacterium]|jgi:hypothetical protein|nr:hypothetical protein [Flavobacteriales bacterium]